jgi:hypothetical protein
MLIFYKQQSYFSQIVSKKAKITFFYYKKQQKIWNLVFSFMYLVLVYPTDRTIIVELMSFFYCILQIFIYLYVSLFCCRAMASRSLGGDV